jgi:hypothetical protein
MTSRSVQFVAWLEISTYRSKNCFSSFRSLMVEVQMAICRNCFVLKDVRLHFYAYIHSPYIVSRSYNWSEAVRKIGNDITLHLIHIRYLQMKQKSTRKFHRGPPTKPCVSIVEQMRIWYELDFFIIPCLGILPMQVCWSTRIAFFGLLIKHTSTLLCSLWR